MNDYPARNLLIHSIRRDRGAETNDEMEVAMLSTWSNKDERQYEHIKASEKKEGKSTKRSKEIAARTVNKQRKKEGRTKKH